MVIRESEIIFIELLILHLPCWEVSKVGPVEDSSLYQQAKSFAESVSRGDIKVKHGEPSTSEKTSEAHF